MSRAAQAVEAARASLDNASTTKSEKKSRAKTGARAPIKNDRFVVRGTAALALVRSALERLLLDPTLGEEERTLGTAMVDRISRRPGFGDGQ